MLFLFKLLALVAIAFFCMGFVEAMLRDFGWLS